MLPLTLASFWTGLLAVIFVLVSVFLILVILIQKPKGGGLSGAFGGAGGSQGAVFGAKTGDVLTWFTIVAFSLFLLLGIGLVYATRPETTTPLPGSVDTPTSGVPGTGIEDLTDLPPESPGSPESPATPEKPATPDSPDAEPAPTPAPTPAPEPAPAPGTSPAPGISPAPAPADGDKPAE